MHGGNRQRTWRRLLMIASVVFVVSGGVVAAGPLECDGLPSLCDRTTSDANIRYNKATAGRRTPNNPRLEDYEGRSIVSVELTFENSPLDQAAQAEFLSLLKVASGTEFSAVRVRDSLQA